MACHGRRELALSSRHHYHDWHSASFYVIRAIGEVQQKLPNLSIDIKFKHEPDALEAQVSGRLSIQYKIPNHLNNTIEFARRHGLRVALLQEDSFSVFVNSASPLADKEELELSDLLDYKLYIYQNAKRFPYIKQLENVGIKVHSQMFHEDSLMVTVSLIKDAYAIRPNKIATHDPYITQGIIRRIPFIPSPAAFTFPIPMRNTSMNPKRSS